MKQPEPDAEEAWKTMKDLIDLRKTQGLKQKEVAEHMGIGETAVTGLERRYSIWSVATMQRYADAIGYRIRIYIEPRE